MSYDYGRATRPRDSQRSRVYRVEQAVRRMYGNPYLGTVEDCQQFVDSVLKRKYVQNHYNTRPVKVVGDRSYRFANADIWLGRIEVGIGPNAKWMRTPFVLLHELAHIFAYRDHRCINHSWEFCSIFLDLVRNVMGKEAHEMLKRGFKNRNVRFKPKQKRNLTLEQREAARQRMMHARAIRDQKRKKAHA